MISKNSIEKYRKLGKDALDFLWEHPEPGFFEWESSAYLADKMEKLGFSLTYADGIPGFFTVLDTGKPGPEIMVIAELDAVGCASHPDSKNGFAHACGHAAQCSALLVLAAALTEDGWADGLSGRIRIVFVPAEEGGSAVPQKEELIKKGITSFLYGKPEFLKRGLFDGVDMAIFVHTHCKPYYMITNGTVGTISKKIIYKGVSTHAGIPFSGKNALYAATQGISAVNAVRETFRDENHVRVQSVISSGGAAVNVIPDKVTVHSCVRAATTDSMLSANKKVNLAFCGGALSLGCGIEIHDDLGTLPLKNNMDLIHVMLKSAENLGFQASYQDRITTGATDLGDLSAVLPVVQGYAPGASGGSHGNDYKIIDFENACVGSALWQAEALNLLLRDEAKLAKEIKNNFTADFTKEEFLKLKSDMNNSSEKISYGDDTATVII